MNKIMQISKYILLENEEVPNEVRGEEDEIHIRHKAGQLS